MSKTGHLITYEEFSQCSRLLMAAVLSPLSMRDSDRVSGMIDVLSALASEKPTPEALKEKLEEFDGYQVPQA